MAWGSLGPGGVHPQCPRGSRGGGGGGGKDSQAKKEFGYLGDQFVATQ